MDKKRLAPTYDIDLSRPAKIRWSKLVNDYRPALLKLMGTRRFAIRWERYGKTLSEASARQLTQQCPFYDELVGIAETLGIPLGKLLIFQYGLEMFAGCTSIILDNESWMAPLHLRTMDWDDNTLKDLSVNINFMRKGKILFTCSTWVGYVGVLTAVKPNVCSISINYRRFDEVNFGYPVGYLVRECLTSDNSYDKIMSNLIHKPLMSPCYIIVTGLRHGSGAIINRDRNTYSLQSMDLEEGYLIQTNVDNDINAGNGGPSKETSKGNVKYDVMDSIARYRAAIKFIENYKIVGWRETDELDVDGLAASFLTQYISNPLTIYCNVMSPLLFHDAAADGNAAIAPNDNAAIATDDIASIATSYSQSIDGYYNKTWVF